MQVTFDGKVENETQDIRSLSIDEINTVAGALIGGVLIGGASS